MIMRDMPAIKAAIAEDSWHFLEDYWPQMAAAVAEEVKRGATPEDIRRAVLRQVGENRAAIALRCSQAAAYLKVDEDNGSGLRARVIRQGTYVGDLEY